MKQDSISHQKFYPINYISKTLITFLSLTLLNLNVYSQKDIKKSPLVHQADSFFKIHEYAKALSKYELSFQSSNIYCDDYYTAARCAAVIKNNSKAFKYLKLSIKNGFVDEKHANHDYYFQNLISQQTWKELKPLFNSLRLKIETELGGIKNIPCYRLIPFCRNKLWGYMDSKDSSMVVKPIFQYTGFMTNISVVQYKSKTALYISNDGRIIEMHTIEMEDFDEIGDAMSSPEIKIISSADGYKGFKHENGYVTEYSDIYSDMSVNAIKIKNKVYGIAYLNASAGIIDEEGNVLKGFEFNDSCTYLMKCYNTKDTLVWFWFTDNNKGTGYKNERGETFFYNIFSNYPGFGNKRTWGFGYEQTKKGSYGIFDFERIKWVVEPQPFEILEINFNNLECKPSSPRESKKLFFLVKRKNGEMYYIDEDLNEYRIK